MTDLTLCEFPAMTGDELAQALENETKKMLGVGVVQPGPAEISEISATKGPSADVKPLAGN